MSRRWIFLGIAKLSWLPLASQLIDHIAFPRGYQIVYGVNSFVALGAFYCATHLQVRQRKVIPSPARRPIQARLRTALTELTQARAFVVFVAGRAALNLGLALVSAVIPIYWVSSLNASDAWVGYFSSALSAATLISYLPWVRLRRKLGNRWILVASMLGSALYPALLSLTRSPVAVLPVVALNGLIGGGLNLAFFDALLSTCPPDKQERFIAINMTAVNLMGVIGPPIGAALLGILHIRWVLVIGTLVALGGASIFAFASAGGKRRAKSRRTP
jgi:Na+/melibiose symporter-like transporter